MRSLLQDPELRDEMGQKNVSIIEAKFSTQVYAREFEDMVTQLSE
jgi:hypothetical protein